jgi:hypothetical protein
LQPINSLTQQFGLTLGGGFKSGKAHPQQSLTTFINTQSNSTSINNSTRTAIPN